MVAIPRAEKEPFVIRERERQIERICQAALERPPAERSRFVATLCEGDEALRGDVERLLAHDGEVSGFLETPALAIAAQSGAGHTLAEGQELGAYTILSRLGGGGMGEVYRARDTTLGREVAIKVLPSLFTSDPERLARFEREALVLAALNHPNIATIYGVERTDGVHALILEVVEGETLAGLIGGRPFLLEKALAVARQIADALEAAHDKGIVHRDLKPANIKVRPDGVVKVLDFGLAKAIARDGDNPGSPHSPNLSIGETGSGAVLGTAAYMSPEQARGKAVDKRTDIWAFGCVLYEILTGKVAFGGDTASDCIAAILEREPDWRALPAATPPAVRRLLRRALEKDLTRRLRDIGDARADLEIAAPTGPDKFDETTDRDVGDTERLGRRRRIALTSVVALALIGAAYVAGRATNEPGQVSLSQLTFRHGNVGGARFSQDGQAIVYAAAWDGEPYRLYSTRVGSYESRPIDLPPADLLALSRSGQLAISVSRPAVDGFLPNGTLAVVALAGGAPRALQENVVGVDWDPRGETMSLVRRVGGQARLEFPVGTVVHEAPIILAPRVSRDGNQVCFFAGQTYGTLMVAERGGRARILANGFGRAADCAWSADGREVWVSSSAESDGSGTGTGATPTHMNLEAISLSGTRRLLHAFDSYLSLKDISTDGRVLMSAGTLRYSVHGSERPGVSERDLSVFDATRVGHLREDGRQLLLFDNSAGVGRDRLFLRPMDGSPAVRLAPGYPLGLSPDGAWVAILGDGASNRGVSNKLTLVPTGAGAARTIDLPLEIRRLNPLGRERESFHVEFSADNRRLMIPSDGAESPAARIYVHDLQDGWTKLATPEGVPGPAAFSPDGRFVAVIEATQLVVYSVDDGTRRELRGGPEPALVARWSSDGRSLLLIEKLGTTARVLRRDIETGTREFLREIRVSDPAGVVFLDVWVSRDAQAYAYSAGRRTMNLFVVEGLR